MSKNDNINIGTSIITYTFPEGYELPKKGDMIETKKGNILIIDSNEENRYIKAMLMEPVSIMDRLEDYREEINTALNDISNIVYTATSEGLFSKIGWKNLPSKEKVKYSYIASKIVEYLNNNELLILDLSYLDS